MRWREWRIKRACSGGSQSVKPPRKYRFEQQSEVLIRREGGRVGFPYPAEPEVVETRLPS